MARGDAGQTRDEIKQVALELFTTHGYRGTSLRAIAERLGITKAALYYHFPSKNELVAELLQPFLDDAEAFLTSLPHDGAVPTRLVFERVFDLMYRHRMLFMLLLRNLSAFADLDVVSRLMDWRERLNTWLVGPDATSADQARAIVALGGLYDSATLLPNVPVDDYREAAVAAALRAFATEE